MLTELSVEIIAQYMQVTGLHTLPSTALCKAVSVLPQ